MKIRIARGSGDSFGVDDISCGVADHLGFFAKQGLDVAWVDCRGGLAAMTAVLEGRAEIAYGGFGPIVSLRARGQPCRIFVSQARALAQALVVQKHIASVSEVRSWGLDAIGALSHHMARLVVRALGIPEAAIRWEAVGPPRYRIDALLDGRIDASLIRTEEALVLHRDRREKVHRLLDFDDLKKLVPLQPHGVLATTESFERSSPEVLRKAAGAMVAAQRALHDDFEVFRRAMRHYVTLPLSDDELRILWQREHDHRGWAVDGELSRDHWDAQLALYAELNPDLRKVGYEELVAPQFL